MKVHKGNIMTWKHSWMEKTPGIHDLKTIEPDRISRELNTNNVFSGEGRDFFPFS